MSLICFTNGSLAREKVKEEFNLSWDMFDIDSFNETAPGNNGNMMLPFYSAETTPLTKLPKVIFEGDNEFIKRESSSKAVRAIVESQVANMRLHTQWMNHPINKIKVTGGGAKSDAICQIIADVFQTPVERFSVINSAGLGAVFRAINANENIDFTRLSKLFNKNAKNQIFVPDENLKEIYHSFVNTFRQLLKNKELLGGNLHFDTFE
jgi:xylulokinase